jgi:hypothetical protein
MISNRKSFLELYEFMSVSKELKKLLGLFFPLLVKKFEDHNRFCFVLPLDQKIKFSIIF